MTIDLQPRLLQWARDRAGLTAETLAEKLGVSAEKVAAWEQDGQITYRQAEKLAGVTHTAFGYLFLAEPPDERLPIPDLRTVGSVAAGRPSPDLLDVIYQSQPNKIGRRFASALIASTLEGKTLFRDAMSLLDMKKTATFQEFARTLKFSI